VRARERAATVRSTLLVVEISRDVIVVDQRVVHVHEEDDRMANGHRPAFS